MTLFLSPVHLQVRGQFIDMKNVIGHMRLAALGLDIIPLLAWKISLVVESAVEWYPLFRPSSILHLGLIPNYLGLFPQLLGLIPHSAMI